MKGVINFMFKNFLPLLNTLKKNFKLMICVAQELMNLISNLAPNIALFFFFFFPCMLVTNCDVYSANDGKLEEGTRYFISPNLKLQFFGGLGWVFTLPSKCSSQ